jgi:hypothetical protein
MVNWVNDSQESAGGQPITATSSTARHAVGSIIRAHDADGTLGGAEFIYLKGVASTVVGSLVTWDGASAGVPTYQTALCPSTANLAQPVAVAMSANVAGQFGWYQLSGNAVISTNGTLVAGPGPVYISATPGQVTSAAAAGKQILNMRNLTATGTPATNQAVVQMERPFAQGAIT